MIAEFLLDIDVRNLYSDKNIHLETNPPPDWIRFGNLSINQERTHFTKLELDYFNGIKAVLFGITVGDARSVGFLQVAVGDDNDIVDGG